MDYQRNVSLRQALAIIVFVFFCMKVHLAAVDDGRDGRRGRQSHCRRSRRRREGRSKTSSERGNRVSPKRFIEEARARSAKGNRRSGDISRSNQMRRSEAKGHR